MSTISVAVFTIQRALRILDPIFELCVFHLPTLLSIVLYLHESMARPKQAP
jgi:hypothetical protein